MWIYHIKEPQTKRRYFCCGWKGVLIQVWLPLLLQSKSCWTFVSFWLRHLAVKYWFTDVLTPLCTLGNPGWPMIAGHYTRNCCPAAKRRGSDSDTPLHQLGRRHLIDWRARPLPHSQWWSGNSQWPVQKLLSRQCLARSGQMKLVWNCTT